MMMMMMMTVKVMHRPSITYFNTSHTVAVLVLVIVGCWFVGGGDLTGAVHDL